MKLNRRESFLLAFGLMAAPAPAAGRHDSLDALAQRSGRRFGSTVGIGNGAFDDPRYRALLTGECGVLVPENELKWGAIRRRPDSFDFAPFDRLMAFAGQNGLGMRGHTLLWHHPQWFPAWVETHDFGANPRTRAEAVIRDHVATVCRRYGPRIHSYDVVNEAVDAETGAMRETAFSRAVGSAEAVVDLAFHTAREAAPGAQLVYNDYMSWEPGNEAHRAGVLRLLEGFRRRGTPVDALGIQGHIGSGNNPGDQPTFGRHDEAAWRRFLDEVVGMGYGLAITEFDVHDRGLAGDIPARDRAVADYARAYLDLMLSYPALGEILVWGMSDRYSWLQERPARPDGLPKRPCPYDEAFRPKPLRQAIADALRDAGTVHRRA
ncbi:endo-1,4-beta-xylanase [Sphingosinicella sp. LHD-64]|uniref:endo-1,4-beta-xylanase n=1 Tax=Sphingosinicella sp. LHD-64 TaxID=3072139 RepID=UPI00280E5F84|nr:endo-1,4-beta-xylanase [Sphingosinicella sp. LHD-64]MDQ8758106.1 endo-1,4-beta-xylanase [Sphingosinicella sp. LHD-64]